jgi:hypothetical protein
MVRGRKSRRIALLACACVAVIGAAPATAGAQSAVDEYTLDIPGGGGSGSSDQGAPPSGAAPSATSSGAAGAGTGADAGGSGSAGNGGSANGGGGEGAAAKQRAEARQLDELDELHSGAGDTNSAVQPDRRSAPEVVADTLLDSAMLPVLGALVLITGVGAWRVLRHRRTLTGAPG